MAGYLMAVTFKRGGTGANGVIMFGIANGMYPNQSQAISGTVTTITAYITGKDGIAPTNVTALVSATR